MLEHTPLLAQFTRLSSEATRSCYAFRLAVSSLDDLKLKQGETQETIFLDSLIRLRGEKLDRVFANIDINELKELLNKYPKYKNKIPKKLQRLCEKHKLVI